MSSGTQSAVEAVDAVVKLSYKEKVPVAAMKEILTFCLQEKLASMQLYDGEKCNEAAKVLCDTIKNRLKLLGYDRYKYVVQVLIGERREQGNESSDCMDKCPYLRANTCFSSFIHLSIHHRHALRLSLLLGLQYGQPCFR